MRPPSSKIFETRWFRSDYWTPHLLSTRLFRSRTMLNTQQVDCGWTSWRHLSCLREVLLLVGVTRSPRWSSVEPLRCRRRGRVKSTAWRRSWRTWCIVAVPFPVKEHRALEGRVTECACRFGRRLCTCRHPQWRSTAQGWMPRTERVASSPPPPSVAVKVES